MKPIVKYQGGKSKELSIIKQYITDNHLRIVEPFCGGGAVSFAMELPSVLYDINQNIINLYQVVSNEIWYPKLQKYINEIKTYNHNELEEIFYKSRDIINHKIEVSQLHQALAYVVVRQLCFSGMERYNSKGEFNVPFGHYQKFSCNLSVNHHEFLKTCIIKNASALDCFDEIQTNDFIFIDPPYLNRLGYSTGDGGETLHQNLSVKVHHCKEDWLIIHCDDEYYQTEYQNQYILTEEFNYSQRWGKDKNHNKSKVNHLYISNREPIFEPSTNP